MSSSGAKNSMIDPLVTHLDSLQLVENKKIARERSINNKKFIIAVSDRNIELVNSLLTKVDINFKDEDGCSPLHWAVEAGDVKIVEILVSNGAHVHSKNNDLETPIDIARQNKSLDIVNFLEASLNAVDDSKIIEIREAPESSQKLNCQDSEVWINPVHGYIYQLKVLMLFLHRGLSHKYSFRLGTEIKEAKKFDDLVFEYVKDNKTVYRLLQAKHKFYESKKITVDKLLADTRGDYSLVKYFYSFQACKKNNFFKDGIIKDVIICTNIDFDWNDLNEYGIEMEKVEEKDDILDIQSDEKLSMRYKFTNSMIRHLKNVLKPGVPDNEIRNFLNHLVFAVNQPNEEELGQIVKKEIGREMGFLDSKNAYNNLLIKMMDLSLGKRNSMFLSHKEGEKLFDELKTEIHIWFNTQDPVSSFTGRVKYLEKMHEILTRNFCVCISGTGGIGKTELVRKYIADYGQDYDDHVVWINAETYKSAADSFRQLATDKLNISLNNSDGNEKNITSIIADVYQFFSKSKSLFIFDNAEKYNCEKEFDCGIDQFLPHLPKSCIKPNIIITSRYQKWPENTEIISLEAFTADEARELIEKMLTVENDKEKKLIDELGKKLQYLPLALQQAVAYIKIQNEKLEFIGSKFGIDDYLEKYSNMAHELLDFRFSEDSNSKYDKSVLATWNITFETLKEKENGRDALDILNVISYFLPDNIPIELLLIFSNSKEKLSSAVVLLKQYSIVTVQHKALSVHRLIQQVTRIKLQKEKDDIKILQNTFKLLVGDNMNFRIVDHVISMWTFASKQSELLAEYLRIFGLITSVLRACGRIKEVQSMNEEVSRMLNAMPLGNNVSLALLGDIAYGLLAVKYNDAKLLLEKGQYTAALIQFRVVEQMMKNDPQSRIRRNFSLINNSIAQTLSKLGKNAEALTYYYAILDADRIHLEETHPDILHVKYCISGVLSEEGKHEEALSLLQEIYDEQKKTLGDDHEHTLSTRSRIASTFGKQNQLQESLEMLEEVYSKQIAILPKNHPDTLVTKFNIAATWGLLEKHDKALKIYQELLVIQKEHSGENHPDVIDIELNMATIKFKQLLGSIGAVDSDLDSFGQVEIKPERSANANFSVKLHLSQAEVDDAYKKKKKYLEVLKIFEGILNKQSSLLGDDHPSTLHSRRHISLMLTRLNKHDAALQCCLKNVQNAEEIYGKNNPETFGDKMNLGILYCHTNRYDKSLSTLRELLEVQERVLGKNHPSCQKTRANIVAVEENKFMSEENEYVDVYMEQMMKSLAQSTDINRAKGPDGETMLHQAIRNNDERMFKLFLQYGAEVFVASKKGNTPLHIAASNGQENFVKLMIQKLDPKRINEFVDFKATSKGVTALHIASKTGDLSMVKCLLANRATFSVRTKDGKTPVDLSTDPEITVFLKMVYGLFEGILRADASGVVKQLKDLSEKDFLAVTNTRNDQGMTLTQVAIMNKQKPVAAEILRMVQKSKSN